ncbi:hypothetical protein FOZ63_030276, partial [Perkinsus olseni]
SPCKTVFEAKVLCSAQLHDAPPKSASKTMPSLDTDTAAGLKQFESFMAHHCSHVQQWMRALCERVDRASLLWTANGRRVGGDDVGTPAAVSNKAMLKGGGIGESMLDEDVAESPV